MEEPEDPPSRVAEPQAAARRRLPIEQRRTQALDAALRLISEHGYSALSVESIARAAGVSKTVVYDAYGGLGPLLRALLEREERSALAAVANAATAPLAGVDPASAMDAWMLRLADAVLADPTTWRLMLIPPESTPAMVREHVQRGRDVVLGHARALTSAILVDHAAIDVELTARSFVALAEEAAKLLLADPDQFTPQRLADFAASIPRMIRP